MASPRLLWTGPYHADLAGRAVDRLGRDEDALWIVATAMARDALVDRLARARSSPARPLVLSWDDLWDEVARRHARPPVRFSEATARAAVLAAIDRARRADELGPMAAVADLPGSRRSLRARFAGWTRAERFPGGPPPRPDAVTAAEWAIYRHYRAILAEHDAEDGPGLAVWASRALAGGGTSGRPGPVAILDPVAPSKAQDRAIDWAARAARSVLVTLPEPSDPDDMAVAPLWSRLLDLEFAEETFGPDEPTGRSELERTVFADEDVGEPLGPVAGLSILGGPSGEGLALLLAREVARRIERGVRPDEVVVLVRGWGDSSASRAIEVLRSWGIPASGGPPRPLAVEPSVSALRLAVSIPAGGWEVGPLVKLLRHGQLGARAGRASIRSEAAAVIRGLRVFRGRRPIESALDNLGGDPAQADRARRARATLDRLASALEWPAGPASWSTQAERARGLAASLGIGPDPADRRALDALWNALDDHATIRDHADRPIDRDAFALTLDAIAAEAPAPIPATRPGTVRFATVDEADGLRARVILLTDLAEGTFPARDVVTAGSPEVDDEAEADAGGIPLGFARERLRFLRVLGSAVDEVVLLVPTQAENGDEVYPAGFVVDVRRRLGDVAESPAHPTLSRLDPTFREHPDLARSPADARVLVVARACRDRETSGLLALARDPRHRRSLDGTAAGLRLLHGRLRVRRFTEYDGYLSDPGLVARIADAFGPGHAFSPSQFESFALCPFQFYQRYVLKIPPPDDRAELRDDHAGRGSRLHKALEEIHASIATDEPGVDVLGRLAMHIQTRMTVDLDTGPEPPGDVAGGLRAIEDERARLLLKRYLAEYEAYADGPGAGSRPQHFELAFGRVRAEDPLEADADGPAWDGYPALDLGTDDDRVLLRGMIDRVDLIETDAGPGFRVIDYKSGTAPTGPDVTKRLRAIQLPLYALAVERFVFGDGDADPACDFGYWTLGRDGFRPIKLAKGEAWPEFRARVVEVILSMAARLRQGSFPVDPTDKNCTRSCDYLTVCRIGQARAVGKGQPLVTILSASAGGG